MSIRAEPYDYPYDGDLRPSNTALVVIDMQVDFCGTGGYVDKMGYDITLTRAAIQPIRKVLTGQKLGLSRHAYQGGTPAGPVRLAAEQTMAQPPIGAGIGDPGPRGRILVRGESGWEIIPEVGPIAGETIIDKPGKGAFFATDFELILRRAGIRNLVLTGITTDVCVHTTMREANDRGFECLLLSDCCGATDLGNHLAAIKMIEMQGGVFGTVSDSIAFVEGLG